MKPLLDDIIKDNAGMFDVDVPPTGHFERFEQRLEGRGKRRGLHWRRWVMVTSAAAIVIIAFIFQYTWPVPAYTSEDTIAGVRNFYGSQLEEKFEEIEKQLDSLDPVSRKELKQDLRSMQNDISEPKENMLDEEQIALIVLRYNAQMESLKHIQIILHRETPGS